jgi:hypothetical protein
VASVENRDVTNKNITAKLQCDRLVSQPAGRITFSPLHFSTLVPFREPTHFIQYLVTADKPAAIDHALAGNGNVREVFTPNQTVMKITMPAVLVRIVRPRLRLIINVRALWRSQDGGARINQQVPAGK